MEGIEIFFVVATLIIAPYLVWDALEDRKNA
jgi:hypothetical protein